MDSNSLYKLLSKSGLKISTDTRTLSEGDIYFGIKGENFDGNSFSEDALNKGAIYSVIDNPKFNIDKRCILVKDSKLALEEIAQIYRLEFKIPIIAIGGSNGKTTTKELINAVLEKKYKTHVTKGNLNNDIGVPLTLLSMPKDTEIAVVEIGANHKEEHMGLLGMVKPTHVLVTNNGRDHLEGFGSLLGVRQANKEIYDWAKENNSIAFVNNKLTDLLEDSSGLERVLYPEEEYKSLSSIYAGINYKEIQFNSSLFGSYNEPNILACIAIGEYFDVAIQKIKEAVEEYVPTLKRSQIIKGENYSLVLDCYNANPSSMELALKDFLENTQKGKRVILVGDMLEMGKEEEKVHEEILNFIKEKTDTADIVICVGPRFNLFKNKFNFVFFENSEEARHYFNNINLSEKFIFVKASRGIKLEEVIKEKVPLN